MLERSSSTREKVTAALGKRKVTMRSKIMSVVQRYPHPPCWYQPHQPGPELRSPPLPWGQELRSPPLPWVQGLRSPPLPCPFEKEGNDCFKN
ncbi:hypothetical protein A6R68_19048 [Neotoma lepida]|uniref:Uncharacterized protein n=1 Tax=Neotoma lepida TaxID=56216 RepID=A0A1A6HKR7_NEOLE|nr:hypothetical protein A6R68_19048 [Neotoma lepida]